MGRMGSTLEVLRIPCKGLCFFFWGGGEESCQLLNCEIKPSYRGIKIGPTMEPEEIVRILDSKSNNQAFDKFFWQLTGRSINY